MTKIVSLLSLTVVLLGCCPFTGFVQEALGKFQNPTPQAVVVLEDVDALEPDDLDRIETPNVVAEIQDPFVPHIHPCEGIYEKYPHDPTLGEIQGDYVGSWHTDPSLSAMWNEHWVFFPSGNYLFFPSQYECVYSSDPNCMPSPIEDGVWGVQGDLMNFAKRGDMNNITSRSIGPLVPSSTDESPYPYKTTIDGLPFWLYTKDTNYWDPETGEYCE